MIDVSILPDNIVICDGSCLRNPGPGGWAFALIRHGQLIYRSGYSEHTTNNIMEMTAVIMGLKENPSRIYTDSSYVVNGTKSWIYSWKRNGWKTSQKEDVKNVDLWKQIDLLKNNVDIYWIKGHADHKTESDPIMKLLIQIQTEVDRIARNAAMGNNCAAIINAR